VSNGSGEHNAIRHRSEELLTLPREELVKIILEQDGQVSTLTELLNGMAEEVAELKRRLGMNSQNSSKPPSSDLPGTPRPKAAGSGRKPGGQPGHPGHCREMVQPDLVETLRPQQCKYCGKELVGEDCHPRRHQVTDVPPIYPIVIEYQQHRLQCPHCGQSTLADLPKGVDGSPFGENLRALIALFTGVCHLSRRTTEFLLETLLNTPISLGAVSRTEEFVSQSVAEPVAKCVEYVRQQPALNVDETGWAGDNKEGRPWLWSATTRCASVFMILRSRGRAAAQSLLGDYKGIVGSDRWSAYNYLDTCLRQVCWSHLKRDFQAFVDVGGEAGRIGAELLDRRKEMFQWWRRVRDRTLSREAFQQNMAPVSREIEALLEQGTHCGHAKTQRTCQNILKLRQALWTFVRVEGVEPTNNAVERAIRPGVLWRRVSFGSHSDAGSRFVERMLTITATLKHQGRNVFNYLTEACHASLHRLPAPSLLPHNSGA
jgi:transposase